MEGKKVYSLVSSKILVENMKKIKELEAENKELRELLELERKFSNTFMTMNSRMRRELEEKDDNSNNFAIR